MPNMRYPMFIQKRTTGVVTRFHPELWASKEWVPFGKATFPAEDLEAIDGSDFDRAAASQETGYDAAQRKRARRENTIDAYKTPAAVDYRAGATPVQEERDNEPDNPAVESARPAPRKRKMPRAGLKAKTVAAAKRDVPPVSATATE